MPDGRKIMQGHQYYAIDDPTEEELREILNHGVESLTRSFKNRSNDPAQEIKPTLDADGNIISMSINGESLHANGTADSAINQWLNPSMKFMSRATREKLKQEILKQAAKACGIPCTEETISQCKLSSTPQKETSLEKHLAIAG